MPSEANFEAGAEAGMQSPRTLLQILREVWFEM
jgi:hypothetical protein